MVSHRCYDYWLFIYYYYSKLHLWCSCCCCCFFFFSLLFLIPSHVVQYVICFSYLIFIIRLKMRWSEFIWTLCAIIYYYSTNIGAFSVRRYYFCVQLLWIDVRCPVCLIHSSPNECVELPFQNASSHNTNFMDELNKSRIIIEYSLRSCAWLCCVVRYWTLCLMPKLLYSNGSVWIIKPLELLIQWIL